MIVPLYSALVRCHPKYGVQLWNPSIWKTWICLSGSRAGHEDNQGLDHLSCEDRLSELELFRLEERWLQRNLIETFQCLKEAYRKNGEEPYVRKCSDRMRGNGFKLKI